MRKCGDNVSLGNHLHSPHTFILAIEMWTINDKCNGCNALTLIQCHSRDPQSKWSFRLPVDYPEYSYQQHFYFQSVTRPSKLLKMDLLTNNAVQVMLYKASETRMYLIFSDLMSATRVTAANCITIDETVRWNANHLTYLIIGEICFQLYAFGYPTCRIRFSTDSWTQTSFLWNGMYLRGLGQRLPNTLDHVYVAHGKLDAHS